MQIKYKTERHGNKVRKSWEILIPHNTIYFYPMSSTFCSIRAGGWVHFVVGVYKMSLEWKFPFDFLLLW